MKRNHPSSLSIFIATVLLILSSCKKGGDTTPTPTPGAVPVLTTTVISNITSNSAQSGGTITSDGGTTVTARGVCYSWLAAPTITDNKTSDGSGTGTYSSTMNNMVSNHGYYVRAYATNANGTGYGNEIYMQTSAVPSVITQPVVESSHKWISGGSSVLSSAAPVTQKGVCWATTPNPTITDNKTSDGTGTNGYSSTLSFSINTVYYVRAYATNSFGTGYGNQVTFTTSIAIGLNHGGGIIFDVDGTGQHGLIAATVDQSTATPWAPGNLFTTPTSAQSTTDGAANTTKIIGVYGTSTAYAAKLCRDYRGGGSTDWFLPSSSQLQALSSYQDVVGGFPAHVFLGTFNYWSSTEYDSFRALDQDYNYMFTYNNPQKNQLNYVRAIRAF
ncbi:hypothetical protein [Ferruginibacter sp.]|nr:hypothetical protein [Ferruginibacter sp.]